MRVRLFASLPLGLSAALGAALSAALYAAFCAALCAAAAAQEPLAEPSGFAASSAPADSTRAPQMSLDEYELLLKPKTKEELTELCQRWRDSLQENATLLAKAQIVASRSQRTDDEQRVGELSQRQGQVARRFRSALAELELKGGDTADLRAYLNAVSSAHSVSAPDLLVTRFTNWVVSNEGGLRWGRRLLAFLAALLVARFAAGLASGVVARTVGHSKVKVSELLGNFFVNTTRNLVMLLGVIIGLSFIGVPVGPFLAAMGAVGFIVGFALQDTLGNFASGIMILLYRPYDLEDVVAVAGVTGKVRAMSLVSTTLLSPDNQMLVIPNKSIWGNIITNITGNPTRRVDLKFGISYQDDIRHAQRVLEQIVASHPKVLQEPAPIVRLHELADSSVNFVCRPWAKTSDYWEVYWDLTREVKERFDEEGLSIPFPQRDVHVHQSPVAA